MAYRQFIDREGTEWEVWDTHPAAARRASLAMAPSEGWLSFQSANDRRRLRPIPPAWDGQSDDQLRAWLASAVSVARVDTSTMARPARRSEREAPASSPPPPPPTPRPGPHPAEESREVNARVAESIRALVEHTRETISRVRRTIKGDD